VERGSGKGKPGWGVEELKRKGEVEEGEGRRGEWGLTYKSLTFRAISTLASFQGLLPLCSVFLTA